MSKMKNVAKNELVLHDPYYNALCGGRRPMPELIGIKCIFGLFLHKEKFLFLGRLSLKCADDSMEKIPSEMEVAPRYNC